MKKNLLNEINDMRKLMKLPLISEQATPEDQACIDKLTDNDGEQYVVMAKDKCLQKMACPIKSLTDNGIDASRITTKAWNDGRCLTFLNKDNKRYLGIWEDGTLSFIFVFTGEDPDLDNDGTPEKIKKFVYEGNWNCTGGVTKYSGLEFKSLEDENGKTLKPTNFKTSGGWEVEKFFSEDNIPDNGDLKLIIEKYFK